MAEKIWANSADSHVMEPADLWLQALPKEFSERAPRTVRDEKYETVYLDGEKTMRQLNDFSDAMRPPGAWDVDVRLKDLDQEGVWGQLAFPSMGLWISQMTDPELSRICASAWNDWCASEINAKSKGRIFGAAVVSTLDVDDAAKELERAAGLGFQCVFLPTMVPAGREYALDLWDPLWTVAEKAGVVLGFHIGTGGNPKAFRGPGGAVINYVETTFPGQRVVTHLVAAGALDRHPDLKVLIAEGGASWVPALADRMDEAYRQHGMYVQPKLSALPSEIIYRQVYTSFQHDKSAVAAVTGMGYQNVMWGDDYPHLEGTYGHTQETLHGLFDGVEDSVRRQITLDTFNRLFKVPAMAGG